MAGVQDVPGHDLQRVILAARHRAAGSHLVTPGNPALPGGMLLERGRIPARRRAAAADPRIASPLPRPGPGLGRMNGAEWAGHRRGVKA